MLQSGIKICEKIFEFWDRFMNAISFQNVQRFLIGAFLFLTSIAVFVPLKPKMPMTGLDPSWAFTLNEAVSRNWVFGKDIIFSFGPYASIYSKTYHPGVDKLMIGGSLFLSICYASLLFLFFKKTKMKLPLIYAFFIAGFLFLPDPLFSSYPFILGLCVYRFTLPKDHPDKINLKGTLHKILPLFFAPLGLLLLIKSSFLPLCAVTVLFAFILLWQVKQKALAYAAPFATLLSCCFFWILSGQPFFALFSYFLNMSRIALNYAEAMAMKGDPYEILLYLIASLLILCCAISAKNNRILNKLSLTFFIFCFLFVAFKTGFVRHDGGHTSGAIPFLIMATILLMTLDLNKSMLTIAIFFSIVTWGRIDNVHFKTQTTTIINNIFNTYSNLYEGVKIRTSSRNKLKKKFENRLSNIHKCFPIPKLNGSTDIYSFQQSYLLSSENTFSFRPVFQSFTAYSPELIKINEMFLRSKNAPDNILFRIEALDTRLQALEEGLSWPTILQNYDIRSFENEYINFRKKKTNNQNHVEHKIYHKKNTLNKEVELPETEGDLYAEIHIEQTFLGKIASFFFRPSELSISVILPDGTKKYFRFISTMGKTKFLLSPLIENTDDFFLFAQEKNKKIVYFIKLKGDSKFWHSTYLLKLYKIEKTGPS